MRTIRSTDRVAVITGGTTGIGLETARILIEGGARVVLAARRQKEGEKAVAELGDRAEFVRTDVTEDADLDALFDHIDRHHGRLDLAFNNAGGPMSVGRVGEDDPAVWRQDVALNLTSIHASLQREIPRMLAGGGGAIVNNASNLGLVGIGAGVSAYVAAKHGVVGLTKAAALEVADRGIRINAIASGGVDTPLFRATMGATPEGRAQITSFHPIGRVAEASEIARTAAFLLSEDASFITATTLAADGGWTAQ